MKTRFALILLAALASCVPAAAYAAIIIPTNFGNGADAEVREESGTANRGTNMEIATRKSSDGTVSLAGNNSAIFLRFDIRGLTNAQVLANPGAQLRIRTRQANNIQPNDVHAPHPITAADVYNRFNVRGLSQTLSDPWEENLITYNTAPGITPDSNVGTEDFNAADYTSLGSFQLPNIDGQNWMAAGTTVEFNSAALYTFVQSAVAAGRNSVTLVVNMALPALRPANGGTTPTSFLGQNYVFLSKDNPTVPADASWDANTADPNNPLGSPWSNMDNRFGDFSPHLLLGVPEPGSAVLLVMGAMIGLAARRRR
jgi:hypothetical protein